nr:HEAT repeat containing protein [Theileria orientalis]
MASLSNQLSSLRDDRSKNLKRFISHYKSNIKWNNIEVSKAWDYFLSINNQFVECESLFSEIIHGSSFLSLDKSNDEEEDHELKSVILDKPKDIDFLTSNELDDLNRLIRTFIDLSVPYFMTREFEHLIDYLIYKYNIAVTFSEYLIVAYIQYNYSEYYCKLLSLFNIRNESTFHSFYNEIKTASMNFTEHKYITSNVVFSGIAKNFIFYKQVSSCYDRLARVCAVNTNIVSFLNAVNLHYVVVNSKVMDNNEIRYVVNMIKEALSMEQVGEYTCSYLCVLITAFTHIQFTLVVQRELIASLKGILAIMRDLDALKIDHLVVFKYIVMSIHLTLQYQKQTLDKLPQDITNSIIGILQKHESVNIVLNNLKKIKGLNLSRTINVIINSLVSATLGNTDIQKDLTVYGNKSKIQAMDKITFFLEFVNESFDSSCMKMIVFNLIDEVNRISSHFRSHGESIIEFDESRMIVKINSDHKFGSTLLIIEQMFKVVKKINPTVLEYTIMEYVNRLSFEMIQDQMEVIMYIFRSLSEDIVFRMVILLNKYSDSSSDYKCYVKKVYNGLGGIKMMLNMFGLIDYKMSNIYKDDRIFTSLVEFIVSMYTKTDSHSAELNRLVFNFINNSMDDEGLSKKLESEDRFWKSVPVKIATDALEYHIQSLIDKVDLSFKYDTEDKVNFETVDFKVIWTKDYQLIFDKYISHISNSKEIERIFKVCNLIVKNNKESIFDNDEIHISKTLRVFIRFLILLIGNKKVDFDKEINYLLEYTHGISNQLLFDLNELIQINIDVVNVLTKDILNNNNITDVENEDGNEYSDDYYGYISSSNRIIFNIFSTLYYQYETLEFTCKSDENVELLHSQFVIIRDLVIKYVSYNVDKQNIKQYVIDFYKFMMCKYESMLMMNYNQFNELLVIKSMETILLNKQLKSFFIQTFSELLTSTNFKLCTNTNSHSQIINSIIDLLRITSTKSSSVSFSITYYTDNNDRLIFEVNVPMKYKHKHVNVDFVNLIRDSHIKNLISDNTKIMKNFDINYSNDITNGLLNRKYNRSIALFDTLNDELIDGSIEVILSIFKMNKNYELYGHILMDVVINTLELIFDTSFKYSTKMLKMLIELGRFCQNTKVHLSELEMPIPYSKHIENKSHYKYKVDIKYDIKMLLNRVLTSNTKVETIDNFSNVISEYLTNDEDFFNLLISKVFITSNAVYNMDFYQKLCSMMGDCDHELDLLFTFLEGLTRDLYNLLNGDSKDVEFIVRSFQEVFTRCSLLMLALSKMNKLKSNNNLVKYVEHCAHLLNICTMFKSITKDVNNKFDGSIEYNNEISEISIMVNNSFITFEKVPFVLLYSLNKQTIWILPIKSRNRFYYSFALYYNELKPNYLSTLIKHMFDISGVDDKVVLGFVYNIFSSCYSEEVLVYIINSIKSLKTYDILIYMIKKNINIDISVKISLVCKIVNNVLVSTEMENKKIQLFLFGHMNDLIDVYLKIICDYTNNKTGNQTNDFYGKLVDTKLDNELKSLNKYLDQNNDDDVKKYKLQEKFIQHINNKRFKHKIIQIDDDLIISLLTLILNLVNAMIDNIYRMDLDNMNAMNKMYNKLYHNICTLINHTIIKIGHSYKLMTKLINNLIVCSIKMTIDSTSISSEQKIRATVIVTINNILAVGTSGFNGELVEMLIDENKVSFPDENISVSWMSYLIYLYFICINSRVYDISMTKGNVLLNNENVDDLFYSRYSKISNILNAYDHWINILYTLIWIHQVMEFDPFNKQGLQINKFKGYESCNMTRTNKKRAENIDYYLGIQLYGYVSYYIRNNRKLNINIDVAFFNDRKSENRRIYTEFNELLYSLLSSMVLYKYYDDIKDNKHVKSNELNTIETNSDVVSLINVISSSILHIFNMNQHGGFNIHIFGTLNAMFENILEEKLKSIESYENVWDNITSNDGNYHYHLRIVSTLMSIQNNFMSSTKLKDNSIKLKYEREFEKLHDISSRILFDMFKYSEKKYMNNQNEYLFNEISQMKADVWEYIVNIPPKSVDSFIQILENSFELVKNHHQNNGKVLWSYLDMIYSLKVLIKMCVASDQQKRNSDGGKNIGNFIKLVGVNEVKQIGGIETTKLIGAIEISDSCSLNYGSQKGDLYANISYFGSCYKVDTNKMMSTIKKFKEVYEQLLLPKILVGDFVNKILLLFLLMSHKYCKSLLNKEFYEFSLNIIINYNVKSSTSNIMIFDDEDDIIQYGFKEYLALNIGECVNLITESSNRRFKYFNTDLLVSIALYYTAIKIDIKVLIRSIYSVYTLETDSVVHNTICSNETSVTKKTKRSSDFKNKKTSRSLKVKNVTSSSTPNSNTNVSVSEERAESKSDRYESIVYKLTILLLSLSYNIKYKNPKSKYIEDLNDIYFIVINFYSKWSYKILFGESSIDSFKEYNRSHFSIEDTVEASRKKSTSFFIKKTPIELISHFERSYFGLISSNKLLDVLEKQSKMTTLKDEFSSNDNTKHIIESDLKNRILFIVILSSLHEYGNLGATNLIMTRLYQQLEDISAYSMSEARFNRTSVEKVSYHRHNFEHELSFDNTWTWFNNCRFMLELIHKSIDTWNAQRGVVPDVIVNSWVKIIKQIIALFDLLPINADIEIDNVTTAFSKSLENTMRSLVNGFITQDDKIVKLESCLSDQLQTKTLNVKIGSLVIMKKLWDDLGINLSVTIKNVMPIIGELVDDENDIVRRLALKLDEKVKEVLYQS